MTDTARERIHARIQAIEPAFRELSLSLHREPELGMNEYKSAAKVAAFLEAHGFAVERGVGGLPTALRARRSPASTPARRFAFLAEYDALPGLGHACGHNLIAATSVAAAVALAEAAEQNNLEVVLVGTPDEEETGGKIDLIRAGVFAGIDAAMMAHPGEHTQTRRFHRAAWEMRVIFHGRASHAVTAPREGINALDAAVAFYQSLKPAVAELDAACRTESADGIACPAILTEGGTRANVVPERAVVHLTLRAPSGEWLDRGRARIEQLANEAAATVGARCEIETIGNVYREMRIDPELIALFERELGGMKVGYDPELKSDCGSTDIGNVSQLMPAIHPTIDISADGHLPGHTPEFAEACAGERAHRAMLQAAEAMALTALEWARTRNTETSRDRSID